MTDGQGSTERHYRRLMDKLKSRSSRIFVKAQMQNRTQESKLKTVINILEKDRDLRIRKAHEGIWKVTTKACPVPRLEKTEGMPSYLSSRPKATTLPTPAELASLLPKKRVTQPQYASQQIRDRQQPPKEYNKISKRKLSTMTPDQVQIRHYRKVMNDWEQRLETSGEGTVEKPEAGDPSEAAGGLSALEGSQKKPVKTDRFSTVADSSAAEESVRMVMRKLGMRPQSSPLYYSSQRTRVKKKRPQTSIGTCDTIIEQKYESKSKVLKTNYLDMYKMQMKDHVTRMKTKGVIPAPSIRMDETVQQQRDRKPAKSTAGLSRATTPTKSQSKFAAAPFIPETRGIKTPAKLETRSSTLMQQTASSSSRKTPRMRGAISQVVTVSSFDKLHDEVKQIQSYRNFRRESLQVDDPDVANMDDVEDGELFEEMKRCRYIRWTKDDEAIIEEMNENEPLQSQLALLTLKYTPQKTPTKKKTAWETMQSDVN